MADVLFVCVREDVAKAEALADLFEDAGFSISDDEPSADAMRASGACVVLWSSAATASSTFIALTQRAMTSGCAIVAGLNTATPPSTEQAPVFDLSTWDGENEGAELQPLFQSVKRLVATRREERDVEALAEEVILSLRDEELAAERRAPVIEARAGWTAELPTTFIPRRAVRGRTRAVALPRVSAARAFALIALIGGSALVANFTLGGTPNRATTTAAPIELSVSAPEVLVVQDFAAAEEPIAEPEPEVRRGLEPPSAETVRRAERAPRVRSERVRELASVVEMPAALTPASVTESVEEHATASNLAAPRRAKREKPDDHA